MYYFNLTLTTLREALSLLIALLRRGNCGQRRQLFHGNIFQGIGQNCKLGETRRCYSWLKLERIRESLWTPRREAESWVWAPDSTDIQEEGTSYHWLPCLSVSIGDTGGWTLQITSWLSEGDGSSRHSEEPLSLLKPSLQNSCDCLHVFHKRPQCKIFWAGLPSVHSPDKWKSFHGKVLAVDNECWIWHKCSFAMHRAWTSFKVLVLNCWPSPS